MVPSFLSNGIRGQHPGPVLFDRRDDGARYLVPSLLSNGIRGQHPGPVLFEIRDDGARYLVPSFLPGTWSRDGPSLWPKMDSQINVSLKLDLFDKLPPGQQLMVETDNPLQ